MKIFFILMGAALFLIALAKLIKELRKWFA